MKKSKKEEILQNNQNEDNIIKCSVCGKELQKNPYSVLFDFLVNSNILLCTKCKKKYK